MMGRPLKVFGDVAVFQAFRIPANRIMATRKPTPEPKALTRDCR